MKYLAFALVVLGTLAGDVLSVALDMSTSQQESWSKASGAALGVFMVYMVADLVRGGRPKPSR